MAKESYVLCKKDLMEGCYKNFLEKLSPESYP